MDNLNGIYIEYHDSLNIDAFIAWVYRDGVNILATDHELLKELSNNKEYTVKENLKEINDFGGISIVSANPDIYYRTLGLSGTVKTIKEKYPDLNLYAFDIGWYTFPSEWKPAPEWMRKRFTIIPGKAEDYFKQFNSNN